MSSEESDRNIASQSEEENEVASDDENQGDAVSKNLSAAPMKTNGQTAGGTKK